MEPDHDAPAAERCANCGAVIAGLRNAPEIPVHVASDRRTCDNGTTELAEFGDRTRKPTLWRRAGEWARLAWHNASIFRPTGKECEPSPPDPPDVPGWVFEKAHLVTGRESQDGSPLPSYWRVFATLGGGDKVISGVGRSAEEAMSRARSRAMKASKAADWAWQRIDKVPVDVWFAQVDARTSYTVARSLSGWVSHVATGTTHKVVASIWDDPHYAEPELENAKLQCKAHYQLNIAKNPRST